jgi:hypothetical protein
MFSFFSKIPYQKELPLEAYFVQFPLGNLAPGVDNIHFDVYLSPDFRKSANTLIRHLLGKHANVNSILGIDNAASLIKERDAFKRLYRNVLNAAINKAKSCSDIQIDFLAQIAIIKMLTENIRIAYESLIQTFQKIIREHELSRRKVHSRAIKITERYAQTQQHKKLILCNVGQELFRYLIDVHHDGPNELREAIFGADQILPDDVFSNPLLHLEKLFDDFFMFLMIDQYVLLGHRFEDPDKYDTLLFRIKKIMRKIVRKNPSVQELWQQCKAAPAEEDGTATKTIQHSHFQEIDIWLKHVENMDVLFNCFQSNDDYKTLKKQKGAKQDLVTLKKQTKKQVKLLNYMFKKLNKAGFINRITAAYEMGSLYPQYCPPLVPQQVLQFLTKPSQRKGIINQLNRLKGFYGKSFSLAPLKQKIKDLKRITLQNKKKYLIRFLKDFVRFHRDFQNYNLLTEAMERVNLASEEKIISLSRENRLLHEFVLPHEQAAEEKPIINHIIIKADVRGSTDITYLLKEKGLNPASYFSLNFFDPITEILFEYAAEKVFIEGDAIILSISEYQDTPEGWYCVARACGLAIRMLMIVQKYNANSKKYQLPILELGVGLSFNNSPPNFLFDMGNRIMISTAINAADRLSGCAKPLRKLISKDKWPFNLYVFQTTSEEEMSATADDLFFRYNVNGIELETDAFAKLSREIDLKELACNIPELHHKTIKIYTGKFPTVSGKYQRLVIREDFIPEVVPDNLAVLRVTDRKYYEVSTNPKLYNYVKNRG